MTKEAAIEAQEFISALYECNMQLYDECIYEYITTWLSFHARDDATEHQQQAVASLKAKMPARFWTLAE